MITVWGESAFRQQQPIRFHLHGWKNHCHRRGNSNLLTLLRDMSCPKTYPTPSSVSVIENWTY
jgi:hypothetical protein